MKILKIKENISKLSLWGMHNFVPGSASMSISQEIDLHLYLFITIQMRGKREMNKIS